MRHRIFASLPWILSSAIVYFEWQDWHVIFMVSLPAGARVLDAGKLIACDRPGAVAASADRRVRQLLDAVAVVPKSS